MKPARFAAIMLVFLIACLLPAGKSHGAAREQAQSHDDHGHGKADTHEGQGHGKEKSDLDRPVDEMWKEKCEHDVLQYTCVECRFELGTVKLVPDLLAGKGKPGIVATGKTGSRKVAESRTFTGEVKLSEGKTVHVASPLPGVIRRVFVDIGATVAEDAHAVRDRQPRRGRIEGGLPEEGGRPGPDRRPAGPGGAGPSRTRRTAP